MTWETVKAALADVDSIAFDGCHKIYVALDPQETERMVALGYGEGDSTLLRTDGMSPREVLDVLQEWWEYSCSLRFIESVRTSDQGPTFTALIAQSTNGRRR